MYRTQEWWDNYFLGLTEYVASASKDPSTKCGAVLVRPDKTIASTGFNGFPKKTSDDESLYADRETKYGRVVHAEVNAILHCRDAFPYTGYTLYTAQIPQIGPSCDRCTTVILQTGINRVVFTKAASPPDRWNDATTRAFEMYREAGVTVIQGDNGIFEQLA